MINIRALTRRRRLLEIASYCERKHCQQLSLTLMKRFLSFVIIIMTIIIILYYIILLRYIMLYHISCFILLLYYIILNVKIIVCGKASNASDVCQRHVGVVVID